MEILKRAYMCSTNAKSKCASVWNALNMLYNTHCTQYINYFSVFSQSHSIIFIFVCNLAESVGFFFVRFRRRVASGFFISLFNVYIVGVYVVWDHSLTLSLTYACLYFFFAPFRVYLFRMGVDFVYIVRILMLSPPLTFFTKCVVHILF